LSLFGDFDCENSLLFVGLIRLLLVAGDLDLDTDLDFDRLLRLGDLDTDLALTGDLGFDFLRLAGDLERDFVSLLGVLDLDLLLRRDRDLDLLTLWSLLRDLDRLIRPIDLDRVRLILLADLERDLLALDSGVLLRVREGDLESLPLLRERDLVLDLRFLLRDNDPLDLERRIRTMGLDVDRLLCRGERLLFLLRDLETERRFLFTEGDLDLRPDLLIDLDLDLRLGNGDLETLLLGLALLLGPDGDLGLEEDLSFLKADLPKARGGLGETLGLDFTLLLGPDVDLSFLAANLPRARGGLGETLGLDFALFVSEIDLDLDLRLGKGDVEGFLLGLALLLGADVDLSFFGGNLTRARGGLGETLGLEFALFVSETDLDLDLRLGEGDFEGFLLGLALLLGLDVDLSFLETDLPRARGGLGETLGLEFTLFVSERDLDLDPRLGEGDAEGFLLGLAPLLDVDLGLEGDLFFLEADLPGRVLGGLGETLCSDCTLLVSETDLDLDLEDDLSLLEADLPRARGGLGVQLGLDFTLFVSETDLDRECEGDGEAERLSSLCCPSFEI